MSRCFLRPIGDYADWDSLIMMVIISNMLRSFWHICFPVVEYFKHGLIQTESAFCQVSGFFVAFATEQTGNPTAH